MLIQTEQTPNPNTVKFLPGQTVMPQGAAEFTSLEEAAASPLAHSLMQIDGVTGVFFGSDFISVSKDGGAQWDGLNTRVMAVIMDHFMTGFPLFKEGMSPQDKRGQDGGLQDEITSQIIELIEERVRPQVAMDGGDIIFDRFEQGIVYLSMRGACAGCPSSTMTLKNGIENMLRHYVPEMLEVRQVEAA